MQSNWLTLWWSSSSQAKPSRRRQVPQLEVLEERCNPSRTTLHQGWLADAETILVRFHQVEHGLVGRLVMEGTTIGDQLAPLLVPGLRLVHLAPDVSLADALAAYSANSQVMYAEANTIGHWDMIPNDPRFNQQYGLHNTGQTISGQAGTVDADIDAAEAWDINPGTGNTIVGIIDSGTILTHEDLVGNLWVNPGEIPGNGLDDDGNGFIDDVNGFDFGDNDSNPTDTVGHGTHVAGIVGAVGNNGIGVSGTSQKVKLAILKIGTGAGQGPGLAASIAAFNYCAQMGITISSNSYSTGPSSNAQRDAMQAAGTAVQHIFVVAAGNSNSNIDNNPVFPAAYNLPNIVAVAATNNRDQKASFSSFGPNTVDFAAPGENIMSTMATGGVQISNPAGYGFLSGTSMATPMVAGAFSLLKDLRPTWTFDELINHMKATADVLPALNGFVQGNRRINIGNALAQLNAPPLAVNDGPFAVNEDQVLNVSAASGVLANDSDPEGDPLQAQLLTPAANGVVVLNANGSFTYTPNSNFFGNDSFTYRAFDGFSHSNPATVSLTVNPVNDDPIAVADGVYFVEAGTTLTVSAALGVLANDSDPDGDPLTAVNFTAPSKGILTPNANGSFTYQANAGATGLDTFTYQASDGTGLSAVTTVTLQLNNRPVAQPNNFSLLWNTTLIVSGNGVLGNDVDLDGDPLTAELVTGVAHGTLNFLTSGGFSYTPNSFYYGPDSFTYRVRDPFFVGNTVTVTLLVEPAPVAGDDFYSAGFGQWLEVGVPGVLANDVNLAGGPITAELVSGPSLGQLQFQADGSFRYLPGNNYNVVDSFTYRVRTASGYLSNLATVHLQITPPAPPPPTAVNDAFSGFQGVVLVVADPGLLANDQIPAGGPVTAVQFTGPASGLLGLLPSGGFTYLPNPGFIGADSFTYRLLRDGVFSNVATVTLQINAGVAPPVALPDAFVAQRDSVLTTNAPGLLANDSDPQGLPLTAVLQVGPQHGVLNLNANGSFTYAPTAGYTGPDQFSYRAFNGTQFSAVTTVNLTVTPPALPPTANPDNYFTQVGVALNVSAALGVLANDVDPQGLPLTAELFGPLPADVGVLNLNADGSFNFTPAAGFVGIALFNYRATNGITPPSAATTMQISVTPTPGNPARRVVVAPQSGMEPRVKVFDGGTGTEVASFLAYEASFQGGVRVATADLTGDGIADIITAPGAGRTPHVKVFDGVTFQQLAGPRGSFLAYTASFTGGVFVAAGDVNGDGTPDIITGPDAGSLATTVRVFNGQTGVAFSGLLGGFTAYASSYKGGVRVAAADLNGDGRADIITAPGAGTIAGNQTGLVRSFDLSRRQPGNSKLPFVLQQFSPYGTGFAGGVFVATGDVDGDGRAEIITGSGAGMVGSVKVYAPNSTVPSRSFTPLAGFTGGLRVAAGDVNGDGLADILVGTGPGTPSRVRSFDAVTLAELFTPLVPFDPNFQGGINLAGRG